MSTKPSPASLETFMQQPGTLGSECSLLGKRQALNGLPKASGCPPLLVKYLSNYIEDGVDFLKKLGPRHSINDFLAETVGEEELLLLEQDLWALPLRPDFSNTTVLKRLQGQFPELLRDKGGITELLKEKIYLQEKRRRKYKLSSEQLGELSLSEHMLRELLPDCNFSRVSNAEVIDDSELSFEFTNKARVAQQIAKTWRIDPQHSKAFLSIPGMLSLLEDPDFELLSSQQVIRSRIARDEFFGQAYERDVLKMPCLSNRFEEMDFGEHSLEQETRTQKTKEGSSRRSDRSSGKDSGLLSKGKKGEGQLVPTARMSHFDKKRIKVSWDECFLKFEDIERKVSQRRQKALLKVSNLKEGEMEKYKQKSLQKCWRGVCGSVVKIQKFFQKDNEQNAKKLGVLCAKERRRMLAKTKRNVKDYVLRGKRLCKEMLVFWKRRGKEFNDLKKKREKIQQELRKKIEEKKEQIKQKRKIQYLIKQSDIYAHIMAEKLGIKRGQAEVKPSLLSKEDVHNAEKSIQGIIRGNRQRIQGFQREIQCLPAINPVPVTNGKSVPVKKSDETNSKIQDKDVEFDFSKIELDEKSVPISPPSGFRGTLKEYQLKGLRWLNNLFEQGINGILADEMGLGKTVQAIALMTHIAEKNNSWGPFLVIAPTITLFNWQHECNRFSPRLQVLPYWGCKKDREVLRKCFKQKHFGSLNSSFHIVITSYSFAVRDFKYLDRVKWQYIILDEAQAIKNIRSQRWSTLLSLKSRNKLLLTGTPIQNTMAELWALLHFIMPQLFDSHEEFQEWFSKDIEAHSQNKQGVLNKTQLNRLHAILKPFMLRRVKKDVEKEIGKKIVRELVCRMSSRQQLLYNNIKQRICLSELMHMYENKQKTQNLMNLVMQFRKVD